MLEGWGEQPRHIHVQLHLSLIVLIHLYKNWAEKLHLKYVANEFCSRSDYKRSKFPTF